MTSPNDLLVDCKHCKGEGTTSMLCCWHNLFPPATLEEMDLDNAIRCCTCNGAGRLALALRMVPLPLPGVDSED